MTLKFKIAVLVVGFFALFRIDFKNTHAAEVACSVPGTFPIVSVEVTPANVDVGDTVTLKVLVYSPTRPSTLDPTYTFDPNGTHYQTVNVDVTVQEVPHPGHESTWEGVGIATVLIDQFQIMGISYVINGPWIPTGGNCKQGVLIRLGGPPPGETPPNNCGQVPDKPINFEITEVGPSIYLFKVTAWSTTPPSAEPIRFTATNTSPPPEVSVVVNTPTYAPDSRYPGYYKGTGTTQQAISVENNQTMHVSLAADGWFAPSCSIEVGLQGVTPPPDPIAGEPLFNGLFELPNGISPESLQDLLKAVSSVLILVTFLIGMARLVQGGYAILTSQGDEQQLTEGKEILTSAIAGIVVAVVGLSVLDAIIKVLLR